MKFLLVIMFAVASCADRMPVGEPLEAEASPRAKPEALDFHCPKTGGETKSGEKEDDYLRIDVANQRYIMTEKAVKKDGKIYAACGDISLRHHKKSNTLYANRLIVAPDSSLNDRSSAYIVQIAVSLTERSFIIKNTSYKAVKANNQRGFSREASEKTKTLSSPEKCQLMPKDKLVLKGCKSIFSSEEEWLKELGIDPDSPVKL